MRKGRKMEDETEQDKTKKEKDMARVREGKRNRMRGDKEGSEVGRETKKDQEKETYLGARERGKMPRCRGRKRGQSKGSI